MAWVGVPHHTSLVCQTHPSGVWTLAIQEGGCVQERTVDQRFYSNEYKASKFENPRGSLLYLIRVKVKRTSDYIFIFLKEGALGQL